MGDEQHGPAFGGVQQVGGERPAGGRVQVGGGLVEDQQGRVGQERLGSAELKVFRGTLAADPHPWGPLLSRGHGGFTR